MKWENSRASTYNHHAGYACRESCENVGVENNEYDGEDAIEETKEEHGPNFSPSAAATSLAFLHCDCRYVFVNNDIMIIHCGSPLQISFLL